MNRFMRVALQFLAVAFLTIAMAVTILVPVYLTSPTCPDGTVAVMGQGTWWCVTAVQKLQ